MSYDAKAVMMSITITIDGSKGVEMRCGFKIKMLMYDHSVGRV